MVDSTKMDDSTGEDSALAPGTGFQETGIDVFNTLMEKHDPAAGLKSWADGESNETIQEAQATEDSAANAELATEQPVVEDKDREKALVALRRAKTPSDMIDGLDDQALTKWGLELAQDQAEVDRRLSQPRERAAEESTEETEESGSPEQPTSPPAQSGIDLTEMLRPLEDYLDSDGTEVLASVMQKMSEGHATELSELRDMVTNLSVDQVLREQEGLWPQLADPEVKEAARGKMSVLARTGGYEGATSLDGLVGDAMRLIGHHQADDGATGRTLELDRKRDGGAATVSKHQTRARPMTDDQRHRSAFSEIMDRHA